MKRVNLNFLIFGLIAALLLTSPTVLLAQSGTTGQLVVTGNNSRTPDNFVTVNGDNALSGRTVFSPAKIATSPDANAKIILSKLGSTVIFSPGSTMNLSFTNNSISGDVSSGTVTIQNIGQTKVNITTSGGAVVFSSQPSAVQISVSNGKTQVCVIDGETTYNNTVIAAGQVQCATPPVAGNAVPQTNTPPTGSAAGGSPNYLLFGLIGAAVAAVVIGVVVANNGGGGSTTPVSPTQ